MRSSGGIRSADATFDDHGPLPNVWASAIPRFKRWVLNGRVRTTRTDGGHHRVLEPEIDRLIARQQPAASRAPGSSADTTLGELSASNRLRGFVEEVRVDGLLAQVKLRVGDQRLTAVITADAIAALELRRGDDAMAIIKSTEVMIARPATQVKAVRAPEPLIGRPTCDRYRADICARNAS